MVLGRRGSEIPILVRREEVHSEGRREKKTGERDRLSVRQSEYSLFCRHELMVVSR
jgi:hypothetical protein